MRSSDPLLRQGARAVSAAGDDALVAALARATVEQAAPEELPLFRATSEAYFADPASLEQRGSGGRRCSASASTPRWCSSRRWRSRSRREVIGFVAASSCASRPREQGEGAIDRLIARLVHGNDRTRTRRSRSRSSPTSSSSRSASVAIEKGRALRLSDERATLLADSLVGSLALA